MASSGRQPRRLITFGTLYRKIVETKVAMDHEVMRACVARTDDVKVGRGRACACIGRQRRGEHPYARLHGDEQNRRGQAGRFDQPLALAAFIKRPQARFQIGADDREHDSEGSCQALRITRPG